MRVVFFVIPARAGIHFLSLVFIGWALAHRFDFALFLRPRFATTDSRPCVVSSAFLAAESLSLACARESNQREHTLTAAVAGEAGDVASALRRFADRPSLA